MTGPFPELLLAAKAGDERAFVPLYRAYQPGLLRYLRVLAGPDVADDLAAEVWYEAARGLARFEGDEDGFRAWLFTTARRRFLDGRRAASRQPVVRGGEVPDRAGLVESDPAEVVAASLSTEGALALISSTLPPEQAEIVGLRVAAHRGLRRLAERLGEISHSEV